MSTHLVPRTPVLIFLGATNHWPEPCPPRCTCNEHVCLSLRPRAEICHCHCARSNVVDCEREVSRKLILNISADMPFVCRCKHGAWAPWIASCRTRVSISVPTGMFVSSREAAGVVVRCWRRRCLQRCTTIHIAARVAPSTGEAQSCEAKPFWGRHWHCSASGRWRQPENGDGSRKDFIEYPGTLVSVIDHKPASTPAT